MNHYVSIDLFYILCYNITMSNLETSPQSAVLNSPAGEVIRDAIDRSRPGSWPWLRLTLTLHEVSGSDSPVKDTVKDLFKTKNIKSNWSLSELYHNPVESDDTDASIDEVEYNSKASLGERARQARSRKLERLERRARRLVRITGNSQEMVGNKESTGDTSNLLDFQEYKLQQADIYATRRLERLNKRLGYTALKYDLIQKGFKPRQIKDKLYDVKHNHSERLIPIGRAVAEYARHSAFRKEATKEHDEIISRGKKEIGELQEERAAIEEKYNHFAKEEESLRKDIKQLGAKASDDGSRRKEISTKWKQLEKVAARRTVYGLRLDRIDGEISRLKVGVYIAEDSLEEQLISDPRIATLDTNLVESKDNAIEALNEEPPGP